MMIDESIPRSALRTCSSPAKGKLDYQAGGTSRRIEWHDGNQHRGVSAPASISFPVDSDTEPLEIHECHLDQHGNTLEGIVHDHNPAPGSLPSPQPQKTSRSFEANPLGQYKDAKRNAPGGPDEKAVRVKTVGKIGKN